MGLEYGILRQNSTLAVRVVCLPRSFFSMFAVACDAGKKKTIRSENISCVALVKDISI